MKCVVIFVASDGWDVALGGEMADKTLYGRGDDAFYEAA